MSAKKKAEAVGLIGRLGRLIPSKKGGGGRSGRVRKNRAANKAAKALNDRRLHLAHGARAVEQDVAVCSQTFARLVRGGVREPRVDATSTAQECE